MRSFLTWRTGSAWARTSPRTAPRCSGCGTCMTSGGVRLPRGKGGGVRVPGVASFGGGAGLGWRWGGGGGGGWGAFRSAPGGRPPPTRPGKIEIFSSTIDSYGYPDCPGHPVWLEPDEWLGSAAAGRFGLQLVANQPKARLHSQLDVGAHSQSVKIAGREAVRMHPSDAAARGLRDGDLVRIFNDRGVCLAGLAVDDAVRPGVAQLSTGAWYD